MLYRFRNWVSRAALLLSLSVLTELPAAAQCAMCYVSASASGSKGIHALKSGILILLIPTLVIMAGIVFVGFRARKGYSSQNWPADEPSDWEREWVLRNFPESDGAPLPR